MATKAKKKTVKPEVALVNECLADLGSALKQFGTYSFDDKGPHEVMDLDSLVGKFEDLDAKTAGAAILKLATSKKYEGRGQYLASSILCEMQEWDELFEETPEVGDYL